MPSAHSSFTPSKMRAFVSSSVTQGLLFVQQPHHVGGRRAWKRISNGVRHVNIHYCIFVTYKSLRLCNVSSKTPAKNLVFASQSIQICMNVEGQTRWGCVARDRKSTRLHSSP